MIAGLVAFDLPRGTTRDGALALYRRSAEDWGINTELVEKIYLLDIAAGRGGGLYLWPSREAAQRHLGADYARMIAQRYGATPDVRLLEAVLRVAPGTGEISEL